MKRNVVIAFCIFVAAGLLAACERPAPRADEVQGVDDAPPATVDVVAPSPTTALDAPEMVPDPTDPASEPAPEQPEAEATAVPAEPTPAPTTGSQVYTVRPGDTLFSLAQQYGLTVEEIAAANGLTNVNVLEVGQQLTIPAPGEVVIAPTAAPVTEEQIHVVQPGENLFRIGLRYGFTVDELAAYNGITNVNVLEVGQQIRIPPRQ